MGMKLDRGRKIPLFKALFVSAGREYGEGERGGGGGGI